ncbi:MAG: hypothetical protein K2H60_12255 [Muribaculaceae bacterium]|nr:hypothetical protein [Muribaculaceae bacterium]
MTSRQHTLISFRHRFSAVIAMLMVCVGFFSSSAVNQDTIYDIDAAKALCDSLPLQSPEGIWIYPEDGVTVLVTQKKQLSTSQLPIFEIRVVETSDVRMHPGEVIGLLSATPERNKYEAQFYTERKNDLLLKPKTVVAQINDEGETMILKQTKPKFNFRFTFNPSILLPKMWRVIRMNTTSGNNTSSTPAIGMVKIYPSYDGNGSSRRQPRYL